MEANWTDPFLFFIYSVAKPLSADADPRRDARHRQRQPTTRTRRAFVVIGTALWSIVLAGIAGLAWSVLDDRERYRMLKYVYVSPSDFLVVLLGRGVARLAVGAMGAVITLVVGVLLLGVPFDLRVVDWPLLVVVMTLGLAAIVAIGIILAAICLQTRQESWSYPEAVAGALFLVSGAVFPLAVLPPPIQAVGLVTPLAGGSTASGCGLPGGPSAIGGAGQPVDAPDRHERTGRRHHRPRLAGHRGAGYTRGDRGLPGERAPRQGSRAAGPDDRLLREDDPHADLRGQPAPGLRGSLPLDRRVPRPARA